MRRTEETICAPATATGGAISVIRVSGPQSILICEGIFSATDPGIKLLSQKGFSICHGEIVDGKETIDEVLVSVFRSPHSYTGEDSVEISCHASSFIVRRITELLIRSGASPATPGEFTRRAFMNGKLDLSQAEAVADLISSETESARRIAVSQLKGGFSDEIRKIRASLLHFASMIELELDFGEEDVEFANRYELKKLVNKTLSDTESLTESFSSGNAIKEGIPVVIAGSPNTGKSTLLNKLISEDRAIVSDIPGTTRDTIDEALVLDGTKFRITDTAGLRNTGDIIEALGIERTNDKIIKSSIVLFICDITRGKDVIVSDLDMMRSKIDLTTQKLLILINKTDVADKSEINKIKGEIIPADNESLLFVSAKNGDGIDEIKNYLKENASKLQFTGNDIIVSNIRHYNALIKVRESLIRVRDGLESNLHDELISIDIRQAVYFLGEITGEITNDEILENIFKNFCIGK